MNAPEYPLLNIVTPVLDESSRVRGTAFYLGPDGLLGTCAHVVEACQKTGHGRIRVQDRDRTGILAAELVTLDGKNDLALLRVDGASPTLLPISADRAIGDAVGSHGYPADRPLDHFPGGYPLSAYVTGDLHIRDQRGERRVLGLDRVDIVEGRSGSPIVSHRSGHIIGVISQRVKGGSEGIGIPGERMFALDPSLEQIHRALIAASHFDGGKVSQQTSTNIPFHVINRDGLMAAARAAITLYSTVVLTGPSGMGKSTLANLLARNFQGRVAILSQSQLADIDDCSGAELVVLDDLQMAAVRAFSWLRNFHGRIVVTTRFDPVAREVLARRGLALQQDVIIEVGGFTRAEAGALLDQVVGADLSVTEKLSFGDRLKGHPASLMAIRDLLQQSGAMAPERKRPFLQRFSRPKQSRTANALHHLLPGGEIDMDVASTILIEQWVSRVADDAGRRALRALCRNSVLGMSANTLATCLGLHGGPTVEKAIEPAVQNGFVKKQTNFRFQNVVTYVPHDLLRAHFASLPAMPQDDKLDQCYLRNSAGTLAGADNFGEVMAEIDRRCARLRIAFDTFWHAGRDRKLLDDRMDEFLNGIEEMFVRRKKLSSYEAEMIANLFCNGMEVFVEKACPIVISIGHSFAYLARSRVFGDMVWRGSACYDTWARATCIRSAVLHWRQSARPQALDSLGQWTTEYLLGDDSTYFYKADEHFFPSQCDMDVAAVVGGYCVLGEPEISLDFLEQAWSNGRLYATGQAMSHATAILALWEIGRHDLLPRAMASMPAEVQNFPHVGAVMQYVGAPLISDSCGPLEEGDRYILSVARAAHSDGFWQYAKGRCPKAKSFI